MSDQQLSKTKIRHKIHETLLPLQFKPQPRAKIYELIRQVNSDFNIILASGVTKRASYFQIEPVIGLECMPISKIVAPRHQESIPSIGYSIVGASLEVRDIWKFFCLAIEFDYQIEDAMNKLYRALDEYELPKYLQFASPEGARRLLEDQVNRKDHHGVVVLEPHKTLRALTEIYGQPS